MLFPLTDIFSQTTVLVPDTLAGSLEGATSLSITPAGLIYLTESDRHRLLVLSSDGVREDSLGARGGGDYRFNKPVSVDATNGLKIYVADENNSRVQLYDRRFQFLSSISADKIEGQRRFNPTQIQVSSAGDLYAYDPDRHVVYEFDPLGNYRRELNLASFEVGSDIQMKVAGSTMMILDRDQEILHRFTADGGYLNFIGGFDGVEAIYGTQDRIWAMGNNRLQEMDSRGNNISVYTFESEVSTRDIVIYENAVYVLSDSQLIKADLK